MTAAPERGWVPPQPDLSLEQAYWQVGMTSIGGIDEAGRGAWAGPVSAGVVVLPPDATLAGSLHGVRDSKQMTPAQRTGWAVQIKSAAAAWGVGMASHQEIDALGILPATRLAARRALEMLPCLPQALLLDWLHLPQVPLPQTALIKGDGRVLSIACASVLAKTSRDALLVELDALYPGYGFAAHKGYGTPAHQAALRLYGPCPIHRLSFKPLMQFHSVN
jgi:ribonuclease HII